MNSTAPSPRPGMGAIPYASGVAFRVWAPHAEQVYVAGSFDDWRATAHPLAHEGNGYWSTDVHGARLGDEYRFVIVSGHKSSDGDRELWRIDPYARQVTHSAGNGVIYAPQFQWSRAAYETPLWNEWVVYEMHIGTFCDEPGGAPGSLDSAIQKLDYLRDLGVNVLQLMPPMEFAGAFSWGYNPANIFAIEDDYGGPDALKAFIQAAHDRGLAVVFDVVYNHFGPNDLDLWQFDGWHQNDLGGIYFYNDWRAQTPWGHTRPDYGRPAVRQYIRDNALMWLEDYKVDGLRWDATAYIRNTQGRNDDPTHDIPDGWRLMQWVNDEIDARQPHKMSIAEDLRDNAWITRDTPQGGAGFDAQWDVGFVHPVREAIIVPDDGARNMYAVRDAIAHRYNLDAFERVIYTESHDEVANGRARVPEEIWRGNATSWASKKRSTLGAALVMTAPGIPMIFQGQEFLEDRWFHDQDPIDWSRAETFSGILQLYRDLIRLRRNLDGTTRGLCGQHVNVHHVNDADKVIAYHRWDRGGPRDDVIVVANLANRSYPGYTIGLPRPGPWKVRLNTDWRGYDATFDHHPSYHTVADKGPKDGLAHSGSIGIGPYTVIVLSQDQ